MESSDPLPAPSGIKTAPFASVVDVPETCLITYSRCFAVFSLISLVSDPADFDVGETQDIRRHEEVGVFVEGEFADGDATLTFTIRSGGAIPGFALYLVELSGSPIRLEPLLI